MRGTRCSPAGGWFGRNADMVSAFSFAVFGVCLPGDSLLITAGIFAAAGVVPLRWLLAPVMVCAILGDQIGYWIGRKAGPALYRRGEFFLFWGPPFHAGHAL